MSFINITPYRTQQYGFFCGGFASGTAYAFIDTINLTTKLQNISSFDNISLARAYPGACRGNVYGFCAGGYLTGASHTNVIDYISTLYYAGGSTGDTGDLQTARRGAGGTNGPVYGFFGGGYQSSPLALIDYINLTTITGNGSDKGDISVARQYIGGCEGSLYGIFAGGQDASGKSNVMDYINDTTTTGDASDRGDLTQYKAGVGGCSTPENSNYGFFGGGNTGSVSNVIEYINITTATGSASDRGDLSVARDYVGGTSGHVYGFFGGGGSVTPSNVVDWISITLTTGNAIDSGDLSGSLFGRGGI